MAPHLVHHVTAVCWCQSSLSPAVHQDIARMVLTMPGLFVTSHSSEDDSAYTPAGKIIQMMARSHAWIIGYKHYHKPCPAMLNRSAS